MSQWGSQGILSTDKLLQRYGKAEFIIPDLQRNYVWGRKQWQQLWEDIQYCWETIHEDPQQNPYQHFMGVITLQPTSCDAAYDVLDGQQRLSTMMVLLDSIQALMNICPDGRIQVPLKNPRWGDQSVKQKEISDFFIEKIMSSQDVLCFGKLQKQQLYQQLLDCILYRFQWYVSIKTENPHVAFENMNATGKNLSYIDLLLNYVLEKEENSDRVAEDRRRWVQLMTEISHGRMISDVETDISTNEGYQDAQTGAMDEGTEVQEDAPTDQSGDDRESPENGNIQTGEDQEQEDLQPLKIKKFLNALHSITLKKPESIPESVNAFEKAVIRLQKTFSQDGTVNLTAEGILNTLELWAKYYCTIIISSAENMHWMGDDLSLKKSVYLLGLIASSKTLPMMLRTLYGYDHKKWDGTFVQSLFGAVSRFLLYAEIYYTRIDADCSQAFRRLINIDRIVWSIRVKGNTTDCLTVLMGDNLKQEMKTRFGDSSVRDDALMNYRYNSSFSKAVLVIDHDIQMDGQESVMELEQKNPKKRSAFEVEHMVAQNLSEGTYSDYGFTCDQIDTFQNMILLEGYINASVNRKPPEEKCGTPQQQDDQHWSASSLNGYYSKFASAYNFKDESSKREFAEHQKSRITQMQRNFYAYMVQLCSTEGENQKNKWISYMAERNDLERGMVVSFDDPVHFPVEPSFSTPVYSICLKDFRMKQDPENSAQSPKLIAWGNGTDPDTEAPNQKVLSGLIAYFLQQWIRTTPIQDVVKAIENNEKIALQAIGNEPEQTRRQAVNRWRTSPYDRRLLHTEAFRDAFDRYAKDCGLSPLNGLNAHAKQVAQILDTLLEINYSYNNEDCIKHLKNIYNTFQLQFPVYVKWSTNCKSLSLGQYSLVIPYENMGDQVAFDQCMHEKYVGLAGTQSGKLACKDPELDPWFSSYSTAFSELCGKKLRIPEYQRSYVWSEDNWDALLNQLQKTDASKELELGTIILACNGDDYNLADGQQRLTTLSALLSGLNSTEENLQMTCQMSDAQKAAFSKWLDKKELNRQKVVESIHNCRFLVLEIQQEAPRTCQYQVFASINGKGKKLTLEEKTRNFILGMYDAAQITPDEDHLKEIQMLSTTPDFLGTLLETLKSEHTPQNMLYDEVKMQLLNQLAFFQQQTDVERPLDIMIDDLAVYCDCYRQLNRLDNGMRGDFCEMLGTEGVLWLELYQVLSQVHTADALLLKSFHTLFCSYELYKANQDNIVCSNLYRTNQGLTCRLLKKTDLVFFLLYTVDHNGNAKKSVNKKFPLLIDRFAEEITVNTPIGNLDSCILSQSDLNYLGAVNVPDASPAEKIWENYVIQQDIAEMSKTTARFLLYFLEYWLKKSEGTDVYDYMRHILADNFSETPPEIEHIWPVKQKNAQQPVHLNRLQNVCLLESNINRSVSDNFLWDKEQRGKLQATQRTKCYGDSTFLMPQMFYRDLQNLDLQNLQPNDLNGRYVTHNNEQGYYLESNAQNRMDDIWDKIHDVFTEDINACFK